MEDASGAATKARPAASDSPATVVQQEPADVLAAAEEQQQQQSRWVAAVDICAATSAQQP